LHQEADARRGARYDSSYAKDPMKITCQSCQAKYTIADEKVLGKIVKIRCKKCSATIVVNGSDPSGAPTYGASETAGVGAGQDEGWTVNVGDGDQRTMTDAEIVAAYQTGVIGVETFCWKDGMSDWLPLREIETLFQACSGGRAVHSAPPAEDATRALGRAAAPAAEYAASAGNGSANGGAARRQGGRAPGADLFHGAAQAGGEEEVMTSAPAGAPQAYEEQKPTGARNENSVLFSLSALTSKGTDRPPPVPGVEASGLIDIRQLSAQMGRGDDKKRSRVDDIMNLSSGGAFNGALSAPTLTAPAIDQYGPPAGEAGAAQGRNKGLIFMALGAGAFVIVGAVGVTMLLMRGKSTDADGAAASASAAVLTAPSASAAAAAPSVTAAATASAAAPEATAAATDSTASAAATAAAATAATAPATTAAAVATAPATPHVQAPSTPAAPAHTAAAPAGVPAALAAAAAADQPFNMGEAKSRLAAAAAAAQSCKKGDGPVGTGHAVIVFAPSGGAQTATISGPPFEGTPTGACVAARFRGVHVPAFSGSPFSVSKSFTIN
jgi:predicted Zn finger-like uncharacterized protein